MRYHYSLCGWRVGSDVQLPELIPWDGQDVRCHITILPGKLPATLAGARRLSPFLEVSDHGAALLRIPGIASLFMCAAGHMVIDPAAQADPAQYRPYVLGTMFGLIYLRRNLFPLHASCVAVNGKTLAFAGPSGVGKSTLAAALTQRGHQLLCDDVCVIDTHTGNRPMVLSTFPRVKLWEDSAAALHMDTRSLQTRPSEGRKFMLNLNGNGQFAVGPRPLHGVYLLTEEDPSQSAGVDRRKGMAGVSTLCEQVYRGRVAEAWGLKPQLFKQATAIVQQVPVQHMVRPFDLHKLDEMVQTIEQMAEK